MKDSLHSGDSSPFANIEVDKDAVNVKLQNAILDYSGCRESIVATIS